MEFHPDKGTLEVEVFDYPAATKDVFLSLLINVEFQEAMDPDRNKGRASVEFSGIPIPKNDWRSLAGSQLKIAEKSGVGVFEGSIGYFDLFNPVDVSSIKFGPFQDGTIVATMMGQIDFTYE